ncbi:MAG: hypothetical protein ACTHNU_18330 [Gaiellales bacterium]
MSAGAHLDSALEAEAAAYRALLDGADARPRLIRARDAYLASHAETGAASWGRLLGALKMAILAGDGVEEVARSGVRETAGADSPASAYVRALAQTALGQTPDVGLMLGAGGAFERTGRALEALAAADRAAYAAALGEILADFEGRDQHLTGVAFADTAAVLERLADDRGMAVHPASRLLPAG